MKNHKILKVDSSGRKQDSLTRKLTEQMSQKITGEVISRDLYEGLPFVSQNWIHANFTDPEQRTDEQNQHLHKSDELVNEIEQADTIIIGAPIYNFSIPAVLKAWIDMIARARVTFKYTENGPVGLLKNKKVYVAMASGGVPVGSELDFASPYLKHVMSFVGITDVTIIDANNSKEQLTELFGAQ